MQKANTAVVASDTMAVTIARFGSNPLTLAVPIGSTVEEVVELGSISLEGREELFVEGTRAEGSDVLEDGDILSIVTSKQAG